MLPGSDQISFSVLDPVDFIEAANILSKCFQRDPMTQALGITAKEFEKYILIALPHTYKHDQISYCARIKDNGEIVGVVLNDLPEFIHEYEILFKTLTPKFTPYDAIIGDLSGNYINNMLSRGIKIVRCDMIGVSEKLAGRGVATGLLNFAKNDLKKKGHEYWCMELTNCISQKYPKKNGWNLRKVIDYRTWKFAETVENKENCSVASNSCENGKNLKSCSFPFKEISLKHSLMLMDTKL